MTPDPSTIYTYVDTPSELDTLVSKMEGARRIALDTEANSLYRYFPKICLIQLTLDGENYILDPLCGLDLSSFQRTLAHKPIIIHDGDYDFRMLRSSLGFRPKAPVFDTKLAAQVLGHSHFGLVALAQHFLQVPLTKKGQKSNWTRRPLTQAQLEYACDDTRYLEPLADLLDADLSKLERTHWHRETCQRMILASGQEDQRDPNQAWRIRGSGLLQPRQLEFLHHLWGWRDAAAREADRPAFRIMDNQMLIDLAVWSSAHPRQSLRRGGPRIPRTCTGPRLEALEQAIEKARKTPKAKWPAFRLRNNEARTTPEEKALVETLHTACQRVAHELDIPPSFLAPRAALEAIARTRPKTSGDIMAAGSLMRWQAQLLAPQFRPILE